MTDRMSPEELEEHLKDAGTKLLDPPTSLDELLPLLDQVEDLLAKVEQSPVKSMQGALSPLTKALVLDELLRHSNVDVKVAVASCISEITRITAPDAPYDDDKMKDVFQLIVSSFEDLSDQSSRSFSKRVMILDTVAKVRSCVVMLDLECEALIAEMFTLFLGTIRDDHPQNVFSSMETVMTLVLDESEDISSEILTPLLACVKKGNQEVLPVAVKLAEKVFEKCAPKLKPYLNEALKSLGASLDDYSEVVTTVCEGPTSTVEHTNENTAADNLVAKNSNEASSIDAVQNDPKPPNSILINGGNSKGNENQGSHSKIESSVNAEEREELDNEPSANKLASKSEDDESETQNPLERVDMIRGTIQNSSTNVSESSDTSHVDGEKEVDNQFESEVHEKELRDSSREDDTVDAPKSPDVETLKNSSSPKASETDIANTASPSKSGSVYDENRAKKVGRSKNKDIQEETPSLDFVSNKASEGTRDSEAKQRKRSGKKTPAQTPKKDKIPADVDTLKNESGGASDSEKKQMKQLGKKVDESSNTVDENTLKSNVESKRRRATKASSENELTKSSAEDNLKTPSSTKSLGKLAKDEHSEETPKLSSKRKRAVNKHKAIENIEYDDSLVGTKVKVWWPKDRAFYEGVVNSFDHVKKKHKVLYNDGDVETLNLKKERWEILCDDSVSSEGHANETASPGGASGMQKREKGKANLEVMVKHGKSDASPKSGATSSSKGKGAITKYARKTEDEAKSKDKISKSGGKTDDDGNLRSKTHSQRSGDKHVDSSSKTALKAKDADSGVSKGKTKQESPKMSSKSKHDTPKTGSKSKQDTAKAGLKARAKAAQAGDDGSANGMGKAKHGSSKTKEMGESKGKIKEKFTDEAETREEAKVKLSEMSRVQETEAGGTKKRRRTG